MIKLIQKAIVMLIITNILFGNIVYADELQKLNITVTNDNSQFNNFYNNINGGYVCQKANVIYYANFDDNEKLYMSDENTTKKIYDKPVRNIIYNNSYLYFIESNLDEARIVKMDLFDYSTEVLYKVSGVDGLMNLYIDDDILYFKSNNKIICLRNNQTHIILEKDSIYNFIIQNNIIYYDTYDEIEEQKNLCSYNLDTNSNKVVAKKIVCWAVTDSYVFYTDCDSKLYKNNEPLNDIKTDYIAAENDMLYYIDKQNANIYRILNDNTTEYVRANDTNQLFNVLNENIYYTDVQEGSQLFSLEDTNAFLYSETENDELSLYAITGEYKEWKQSDSRWASKKLNGVDTMAHIGCAVTSVAIGVVHAGMRDESQFNPGTLCDYLNNNGGFDSDGGIKWKVVNNMVDGFWLYNSNISISGTDSNKASQIKNYVDSGYIVLIQVNSGSHWVTCEKVSGSTVYIMDPGYTGRTNLFSSYSGSGISRIATYGVDSSKSTVTQANNPQGYFDGISAGPGYIHVTGWAFDADDTSQALSVHVYIGGPAGEGEGHIITADVTRTDVNKVYSCGNNHGFEATIPTDKTGDQSVYIYAINIGGGSDNTLLTNSPKTTTISKKLVHTVAYNANGGSGAPDSQTKRSGVQMNLSTTTPTRYCYNFVNWNTKADGSGTSYNPGANYTPDQDGGTVTLYAIWTPYKHTVAYNANGGSGAPASQTKTADVQLNLSTTKPTRTGYTFVKWNTKADGSGTSYNSGANYTPDQDGGTVTLYAVWEINKYTISYNANGGSGAPSAQTKTYGTTLTLSSTKPTRTGYTFQGWATSASATSATYSAGGSYTSNSAATLYAVWKADTYTITYNANGGSGAPSAQTKTYGTTLTLSSTKPTRTGYTFQGWATSASATSATYSAGGSYTANSAATLYAVWSPYKHTVAYNANGGSGAPDSQTKTYGVKMLLSSTKPTRTGYTFQGWATTSTGTATYQPGDNYTPDQNGGTVTLYAVWELKTYTISYNTNGGNSSIANQTKEYGKDISLASEVPTKYGYQFVCWLNTSDDDSATYNSGDTYSDNADAILKAVWKKILIGDVNNDKIVDEVDAALIMRHISNTEVLDSSKYNLDAADCDGDGTITLLDAIWILNNKTN